MVEQHGGVLDAAFDRVRRVEDLRSRRRADNVATCDAQQTTDNMRRDSMQRAPRRATGDMHVGRFIRGAVWTADRP